MEMILNDDFCVKATLNAILSGKVKNLNGYKVIISHEPGSQRLLNLEEKGINRKLNAYVATYLKVKAIEAKENLSFEQVMEAYKYDMQGILIDINVENKTIYIIDGQQRLTLHFVIQMFLNIFALKNRDSSLSHSIQSNAGVKVNDKYTFTKPSLQISTLNSFNVEISNNEGEIEIEKVSDFMKMLNLYNHSINYFKSKQDFTISDFLENMNKRFESENNESNSMYLNYIITVFTSLEKLFINPNDLIVSTQLIRVTVNVKSPYETISEALIKQGIKPAVMNASIFALTSMFQNIKNNPESVIVFNRIYQKLMTRTINAEKNNDFFFQILVSKYEREYFVSKNLDSVSNIFSVVERIIATEPNVTGLTLIKELEEISDTHFDLHKSKDSNKKYKLINTLGKDLTDCIKSKNYELLYGLDRLLNEHGLDEKTFFILIPFILVLKKLFVAELDLTKGMLNKAEQFVRTINLFLFSKKESINNLKGVQGYFSYLAGIILNIKNKKDFNTNISIENLKDIQLTDIDVQSLLKTLETNGWKGTELSYKSFLRECQLGFVHRVQDKVNKDFILEYPELSERNTSIEIILDRYFSVGNNSEEFEHFESVDKKKPTLFQLKIRYLITLSTITSKRLNRNKSKSKENCQEVISRDQGTSNMVYSSSKSGLNITNGVTTAVAQKNALILHKYLFIEKMKDFFVRNSDIIIFTNNIITESINKDNYQIINRYEENSYSIDYSINKIFLYGYENDKQEA